MCAGRTKMFQKSTTSSPSTRLAFYAIALLLLACATQRASSMSLERLGVDQNDLNSAAIAPAHNDAEKTVTDNGAADITVDDMELDAVPASGNTDTYLLVPAGGAAERESVEKNTIESAGDSNAADEEPQANEATDMLMVESNDAPMHVSFLAVPAEQSDLVDADQVAKAEETISDDESVNDDQVHDLADKILEVPTEPELQEVVPVVAEEVPLESFEKLIAAPSSAEVEHDSLNEHTVSAEHETIADMIADAMLEVEKDIESAQLGDELPSHVVPVDSETVDDSETNVQKIDESNQLQEIAEQEAIESLSAMEEDLLPEVVSVPVEAVHIEHEKSEESIEPFHVSDSTVEQVNVEENEIKHDEHTVESEIPEDLASQPEDIIANAESVPIEIVDVQPESAHDEDSQNVDESNNNIVQTQSEENEIANSNAEAEHKNTEVLTKEEDENASELSDEIKVDVSEDEVNPMAEAIEKEIEANLADMIAEDSKVEEIVAEELTPNQDHEEDNKQDDEITEDKHVEETQIVEEAQQTENDQVAKESQTAEEFQTIEDSQTPEESQVAAETQTLEGNQIADEVQMTDNDKQEETEDEKNVQVEEIKPEATNNQLDQITQDAMLNEEDVQEENVENLAEEALPVGEVAELPTKEDYAADEIPQQESTAEDIKEDNKMDEASGEAIKQDAAILEETQEIKEEQVEPQLHEEELQETEANQAETNGDATQNNSQQITEEKLEEESTPTEAEAAPETEEIVEEKLELVQNPTEAETQPEVEKLEVPQVIPSVELVQEEEQKPETPLQLAEDQEEQEQQQQEAQETPAEEQQQHVADEEAQETPAEEQQQQEEAQEAQPEETQQQNVEDLAQNTPTEEVQQQEEAQETLNEEVQQPVVEEIAQETQPELSQQQAEEQQQPESVQIVEEHVEEEMTSVQDPVEQLKQEESTIQQQSQQHSSEEQPPAEAQPPVAQQILADEPAEVPTEIVSESLNSGPNEATNSLLTTIIQVPQQQQIQQQQPSSVVKVENDETPLMATLVSVNNPPAAAAAPTAAPLNVMDSVLNYVNASFMQLNGNKQQLTTQNLKDDDDDNLNAQLRRYDGAQVWRIVVQSDHDRKMADELQTKYGGQLWKEVKQEVDYLLKPQVLAEAAQHVRAANLSRIVLIDNLQNVIETENPSAAEIAQYQNRKGHRLTWKAYHRLDDIHSFFDTMAQSYPDLCSVETIGYSLQKRPLKILKISNGNPGNRGIWIDGGMHAREWISPATVTFIANQLIEDWENLPEYMRNVNWYIHAVANPDGYEYTHTTDRLWRKNMRSHGRQCPGVDLNRNFGYKWGGKGTSANPCSQTYRGSKAFSEPETFYISKFISNQPRDTFQAYLSFHSYGQYILYPWGYDYHLTADKADLDRVARQAGTTITKKSGGKYTVGSSATTLYPAAGGSDDWAKGFAGIKYAYTIEMGDTGRYGFVLPASHIEPNGRDGYTFAETVARAVTQGNKYSRKRAL